MKIQLEAKPAREAIGFVAGLINGHTTLPILAHLRFTATPERAYFTSTDLDVMLSVTVPVPNSSDGAAVDTCLPAKLLNTKVKCAKRDVVLEPHEKGCHVEVDGLRMSMLTLPPEEFVVPWRPGEGTSVRTATVERMPFLKALSQCAPSMSTDESRYVLNGVLLEFGESEMRVISTDGRRLCVARVAAETGWTPADREALAKANAAVLEAEKEFERVIKEFPPVPNAKFGTVRSPECKAAESVVRAAESARRKLVEGHHVLVPSIAVKHLLRFPNGRTGPITIESWDATGKNPYVSFTFGPQDRLVSLTAKQIEGNYPNYRQVIPTEFKEECVVPMDAFTKAVEHAASATSDKCNSIYMTLNQNNLNVRGYSHENGEAKSDIEIGYSGKEIKIAFYHHFITEICEVFKDSGDMRVKLTDELSPGVFEQGDTFCVIMPMRLS